MNTASPSQNSGQISTDNNISGVKFGGRVGHMGHDFEIFFDHPLPRFAPPNVSVYHARSSRGQMCLAYLCDRNTVPRKFLSEKYSSLQSVYLPKLVGRGIAVSPEGIERFCFIYENNFGNPIVPEGSEPQAYGWRPDIVLQTVIKPMLTTLQELHNADMVHGGIRVTNLFDNGTLPLQRVMLGDCLANTYISAQPELYLPPPLALAHPMGRGLGSTADDIYAFGVTCAILLRTHDPFFGKPVDDVILNKIDMGTFSTLIENERLPSNILELLRGLLYDDPESRWTIHDVQEWMDGKRVSHRQGAKRLKGSRHLILGDHKILFPSFLSYYGSKDITRTVKLVESGEIKQWIRRSVSDARLDTRYDMAVEDGQEKNTQVNSQERMVCRLSIAMEPNFPILYNTIGLFPESFGTVLADFMIQEKNVKPIVELINDHVVPFWMNMQNDLPSDFNMVINKFEQCQQFIKQRLIGYGIERCVYFLSPEMHCLSPGLKNFYVHTAEQLAHALNIIADLPNRPERPLDRHMIAFLSVRERQVIERYLPDLGASEPYRTATGIISVFAAIQATSKLGPLPGLSRWVVTLAEPLYERFHDRDLQKTIRKKIEGLKDSGQITKMADILFDHDCIRRDQFEFRSAMNEYYQISVDKIKLNEALKTSGKFGIHAGRDVAALIAGLLMSLSVAGFVLIRVLNGGIHW